MVRLEGPTDERTPVKSVVLRQSGALALIIQTVQIREYEYFQETII